MLLQHTGATPRVAMEAMRHSDMRLTQQVYTDAGALPIREAIESLPSFSDSLSDSLDASPPTVSTGHGVSATVAERTGEHTTRVLPCERTRHEETRPVAFCHGQKNGGGGGNRTVSTPRTAQITFRTVADKPGHNLVTVNDLRRCLLSNSGQVRTAATTFRTLRRLNSALTGLCRLTSRACHWHLLA